MPPKVCLLALAKQGQQWTKPGLSAQGLFSRAGVDLSVPGFRRVRRGIIAGERGHAIIGPAPQRRNPDWIIDNGKKYQSNDMQQLYYHDAEGNLFDLSTLGG